MKEEIFLLHKLLIFSIGSTSSVILIEFSFNQTGMFYYIQAFLCLLFIRLLCCKLYYSQFFFNRVKCQA